MPLLSTISPSNQRLLGSSAHFQLEKLFLIHAVRHCLCIKCNQFETKNIAEVDMNMMETTAKTANHCFVNALSTNLSIAVCLAFVSIVFA